MNIFDEMRPKMTAYLQEGWWHVDKPGDAQTIALFGTSILPTPWSDQVPADWVQDMLEELNPGHAVTVVLP